MGTWRSRAWPEQGTVPGAAQRERPRPLRTTPAAGAAPLPPPADTTVSPAGARHCQGLIRCRGPSGAGHLFGFGPRLDNVSRLAPLPRVMATAQQCQAGQGLWSSAGCRCLAGPLHWLGAGLLRRLGVEKGDRRSWRTQTLPAHVLPAHWVLPGSPAQEREDGPESPHGQCHQCRHSSLKMPV